MLTSANGESLLYLRPLESLEARAMPGTEDAGRPFWSPDSKSLAFVAAGKLKRMDVAGAAPVTLCDARNPRGGTWNDDGVILFGDQLVGLQRIPASGGTPSSVTQLNNEAGETAHYYPQFLPGGKEFLYLVRYGEAEKMGVFVGVLDGKPATRILQTQYKAVYDAISRRLLYMKGGGGTLMASRLDLDPPRLSGDPTVVAEQIGLSVSNGFANISVSRNGTLAYGRGNVARKARFGWRDRAGKLLETIGQPVESGGRFALSPDGGRLAYNLRATQADVWVLEVARGVSTRVTFSNAALPIWSPDGKHLYYRNRSGIHRKSADGSGEEELVIKGTALGDYPGSVAPDGKHLLLGSGVSITVPLTGERKSEPYLQGKYGVVNPTFSPDGRWVAYQSDESGRMEIYVQGFPERRGKWTVSSAGGRIAHWRADGKELYWLGLDDTLMAASVELQAAGVRVGRAERLFRLSGPGYQPARDGRRFLVLEPEGGEQPDRSMVVIQNWAAALPK